MKKIARFVSVCVISTWLIYAVISSLKWVITGRILAPDEVLDRLGDGRLTALVIATGTGSSIVALFLFMMFVDWVADKLYGKRDS